MGEGGEEETVTKDTGLDFPGKEQNPNRFRFTVVPSHRCTLNRLFLRTTAIPEYHFDVIEILPTTLISQVWFTIDKENFVKKITFKGPAEAESEKDLTTLLKPRYQHPYTMPLTKEPLEEGDLYLNYEIPEGFGIAGVVIPKQADLIFEKRNPIADLIIMKEFDHAELAASLV